ncbi:hypothetical protein BGZ96_001291 [Linnemannia gamsii]|uniref:Uncharacterized protein n=1 Tax=Linnemannia gamsii TaxID=64522 RepID=A0ABQ7K9R0_9FUNG|nr:hypothetical protein BGZ96_001291 [Linnemannia gamsii]
MNTPAAYSSSPFSSAPNSRPQRLSSNNNNRKSGLTNALQNQNQNQNHTQSRYNNNNNTPRHTQRAPDQVNYRHQSMPPQQRGYANNSKSRVDTATGKSLVAETADSGFLMHHVPQHQQRQQRNQFPHPNSSKPRPQSQPQPSKARRVQRRKEIDSMTESLACVDLDLALHQSPPLDPTSPPSSSDSDDSESTLSRSNHFLGPKAYRNVINNPPQRPSSVPTPQTHYSQRTSGVSRANLPFQPSMEMYRPDSADKVMLANRVPAEKKNGLYAGPTFHNSPAPTSLPIPSFARSLGNSPVEPSVEKHSAPFFGEAASPQLNSMYLQSPQQSPPTSNWSGHHSTPMGMNYFVPDRMATSSFVPHGSAPHHGSDELMEISQNLRMLLKIQSQ